MVGMRIDPELLRSMTFVLMGLLLVAGGGIIYVSIDQLIVQIPSVIPRATTYAPEAVPVLQYLQTSLSGIRLFAAFAVFVGLFTLASGALSMKEMRRRPPAWAYQQTEEPRQTYMQPKQLFSK
ncbi:MAG: hypothetical protein HY366_02430 [Candidatus Aenigmarchaeota archaeon]|nr:hypothetical protein [Candidatus Aenigmarchaeota archaeon]